MASEMVYWIIAILMAYYVNSNDSACLLSLCKSFKSKKVNKTNEIGLNTHPAQFPSPVMRSDRNISRLIQEMTALIALNGTDLLPASRPLITQQAPAFNKLNNFRGIRGCKAVKLISKSASSKHYFVRMPDLFQNQEAALKVFDAYGHKSNRFECERERAVLQHIAMHECKNNKRLQIAHIRDDIKGIRCPNLMLEYIHGFDLNHQILKNYAFPMLLDFVTNMMKQIGFGVLNDLHSISIYHNDLKPNNIMFDTRRELFYLIDFASAIPLALMNHWEFYQRTNIFTSLQFMSPWHLKLAHESRCFADGVYKYSIVNDNLTRIYLANADFYSFGLTVIRILGMHCNGNDSLCLMSKRIFSIQNIEFDASQQKSFIHWDIEEIERVLTPYWSKIHDGLTEQIREHPDSNYSFMSRLTSFFT